jgi:hypothetical protein
MSISRKIAPKFGKLFWLLALGSFLLAPLARPIAAFAAGPGEGGRRVRMENEPAGPYLLRVVTSPTPPRIDNLYIEVRVSSADTGQVLDDVDVQIITQPLDQVRPTIQVQATHDIAPIPNEYAAHIPVDQTGLWSITVSVDGGPGQGQVSFDERISGQSILPMIITIGAPVVGLLILVAIFVWLQRNSQRAGIDN